MLTHPEHRHVLPAPALRISAAIMRACLERADAHRAAAVFCSMAPAHCPHVLLLAVLAFSMLGDWWVSCDAMSRALCLPAASSEPECVCAVLARLMVCATSASAAARHCSDTGQAQAIACSLSQV
jgi:hypothetical protein